MFWTKSKSSFYIYLKFTKYTITYYTGQPKSWGIQATTEDPHSQTKGSRSPRRIRREDGQEAPEGSRQARRSAFSTLTN